MTVDPRTLLSPARMDVLAAYIYAKHRALKVPGLYAAHLYAAHMLAFNGAREPDSDKRGLGMFFDRFHALLDSVERDGYRDDAPAIPVGAHGVMTDGAHRLAACLVYDKPVRTEPRTAPEFAYTAEYLLRGGVAQHYVEHMVTEYCGLARDIHIALLFPQAVMGPMRPPPEVYFKRLILTERGVRNLMAITYPGESWTNEKARVCFPAGGGELRAAVLQGETAMVQAWKADVRAASGVANHSIHVSDAPAEAMRLLQALLNENSVDWLNRGTLLHRAGELWPLVGEPMPADTCVDGSTTLSAYGLRYARDLDVLTWPEQPGSHNAETAQHHVWPVGEIVYSPRRHFWAGTSKSATLETVRAMKERRKEPKDLTDLELMGPRPDKPTLVNVCYGHLQRPFAEHRGKCSVVWTAQPVEGADLYAYADAFSYQGITGAIDVLLMLEPHTVLPGQYSDDVYSRFDQVFTFVESISSRGGKFQHLYLPAYGQPDASGAMREVPPIVTGGNRKNAIVMIHGDKHSDQPGEMYSERRRFAEWFAAHGKTPMDVYGRPAFQGLANYRGECADKHATLAQYRFALCFDNTYDPCWSRGYFTREVLDALYAGCIPIVKGCYNIQDYLPDGCYIDASNTQPEGLDDLATMPTDIEAVYHECIAEYLASEEVQRYHAHATYMRLLALCGSEPTGEWLPGLADGRKLAYRQGNEPVWNWAQLAAGESAPAPRKRLLRLAVPKTQGGPLSGEFLQALRDEFGSTSFVETGTGSGQTAAVAASIFERVHTVELSEDLYRRFNPMAPRNVQTYCGESPKVLRGLERAVSGKQPVLWLDAHWSGEGYAKGPENCPLLTELAAIATWQTKPPVILMDDMRYCAPSETPVFPGSPTDGFPSLAAIQDAVQAIDGRYDFVLYGDIGMAWLPHDGFDVAPEVRAYQGDRLKPTLTSILILNHDGAGRIEECLASIRLCTRLPYELVVIDNASTDGSLAWLREQKDVRLIENATNVGCPPGRAQGLPLCKGDYVVLLDNDTVVTYGWLETFQRHARHDLRIGLLGPRSNYVSGPQIVPNVPYRDWPSLVKFACERMGQYEGQLTDLPRLVGFCMFMTRACIDKVGNIDGSFGMFGYEDHDITLRAIQAGFRTAMAEDVFIHHTGGPQGHGDPAYNQAMAEARERFLAKWNKPRTTSATDARPLVGALVFSKDRAAQCELALRSLKGHCQDTGPVVVLYAASTALYAGQYLALAQAMPDVTFQRQGDFRTDVEAILADWQHVCFVVDDTIFTRDFSMAKAVALIGTHQALGFSLRLGGNITHGGPPENAPFQVVGVSGIDGIADWRWAAVGEARGWGYPLEVSSSVYPTAIIRAITARQSYHNPNELECVLDAGKDAYRDRVMLCFTHSVALSAVWNKVQAGQGWASDAPEASESAMAAAFAADRHLDWQAYNGWEARSYHALPLVYWEV